MSRKKYIVEAERSGRWWALRVPEVPGVFSQARRIEDAKDMARSAIAAVLEVDPDSFDIGLNTIVRAPHSSATGTAFPPTVNVQELVDNVRAKRAAADKAAADATEAMRDAARQLRQAGLPLREAGEILGVTYQRVQQIVEGSARAVGASTMTTNANVIKAPRAVRARQRKRATVITGG